MGFNIFSALTVDLLHEFEQGIWKDLFVHLLRILDASGTKNSLKHKLDVRYGVSIVPLSISDALCSLPFARFRHVPGFGRAIRRFGEDVSAMKRGAARDWEDLLQVRVSEVR